MRKCLLALIFLVVLFIPSAFADTVLWDYGFQINGDLYFTGDPLPAYINSSGFDFATGYGHITMVFTTPGNYNVMAFFDIDPVGDLPIDKDLGQDLGTPPSYLSWEIGDPYSVVDDLLAGSLQNKNLFGPGEHGDISVALALDFSLLSGMAAVDFWISPTDPPAFLIEQVTPDGQHAFYSAELNFSDTTIPEPASLVLLGTGLLGLAARYRRRA